jgi:hypothetical protein
MARMQRMTMRTRMLLDRGRAGDRLTAELDHHIEAQTAIQDWRPVIRLNEDDECEIVNMRWWLSV